MKHHPVLGLSVLLLATPSQAAINISSAPTKNMSCGGGVCTATAQKAVLNVVDLTALLASGDTMVKTGGGALDIEVDDALSWTSSSRLSFTADHSLRIEAPVTVAGNGAVTISTNLGGTDGDLRFKAGGRIDFANLAGSVIVNGQSYMLKDSLATLASAILGQPSGFFALANDYDAAADGKYTASPIAGPFSGGFEGLGHSITHLTIATRNKDNTGLFGEIAQGGLVRDVVLDGAKVSATVKTSRYGCAAGLLAGTNNGTIVGALTTGSLQARCALITLGGVVGYDSGAIVLSQSTAEIFSQSAMSVGGLAGFTAPGSTVDRSSAAGAVSAVYSQSLGGLVGENHGTITNSHATGSVSTASGEIGGLIGYNAGMLSGDFATGTVTLGISQVANCALAAGGLVGIDQHYKAGIYIHSIENSYATGAVSAGAANCAGGLIGAFFGRYDIIATSYATGTASAPIAGGFAGFGKQAGDAVLQSNYWDTDSSGLTAAIGNKAKQKGIAGLSDAALKAGLPAGFDPAIWGQKASVNNGYPYLLANPPQ